MSSLFKRLRPHKFALRGKVALVTGGADGIGWETTQQLHQQGCKVVIVDHNAVAAEAACNTLGQNALWVCADVTDRAAMQQAIAQAIEHFGGLDVVVANAGITPPSATLRTSRLEDFDKVMAVNVTGVLNTIHPALENLIERQGHIVVVASCAAFCPPVAGAAYMISKAAVEQLARGLKLELVPHGVTVTTAYFGLVDTQLAQATLDHDPVGQSLNQRLPAFLQKRMAPKAAGLVLVKAIQGRAPVVIAPTGWMPYAWLRGMANPLFDKLLVNDTQLKHLLLDLEQRHTNNNP
ncbi:MAG TPA: short-chain dehydrogenase/reductase [Alcanivoracaceae bacterium]|nr:short-chain dehydrogenase/reductase [Alcanivoracaceae bacterium]